MSSGRPERYGLSWAGKREAMQITQTPPRSVLVPDETASCNYETTRNMFIEGDNLEALKLLTPQYAGRVKLIYIDPPYNTGKDLIYRDNYTQPLHIYLKLTGQKDTDRDHADGGIETNGRYHAAWLSMMYPRLCVARKLLREDGLIVVSIDDTEFANLRLIMNEVFGEENFLGCVLWKSTRSVTNTALISVSHTYNLVFARSKEYFVRHRRHFRLPETGEGFCNPDGDPRGPWKADPFQVGGERPNQRYPIRNPQTGRVYYPKEGCSWKNELKVFERLLKDNRIVFGLSGRGGPQRKRFLSEARKRGRVARTWWDDVDTTANATRALDDLFGDHVFDNPKPVGLIKRFIRLGVHDPEDAIILDFFAGSCSTAQAVLELNREDGGGRRFICIQLPEPTPEGSIARKRGYETISEIGRERIRRVIARMSADTTNLEDLGFKSFKLVLKSDYRSAAPPDAQIPDSCRRKSHKMSVR